MQNTIQRVQKNLFNLSIYGAPRLVIIRIFEYDYKCYLEIKNGIEINERFVGLILPLKSRHMINESSFPAADIYLTLPNINFIFYNSQIDNRKFCKIEGAKSGESTFHSGINTGITINEKLIISIQSLQL